MVDFGNISSVGIPPDAAGKRMNAIFFTNISYTGAARSFVLGERIAGRTNNTTAIVINIRESTPTSGEIDVFVDSDSVANTFDDGEQIEDSTGTLVATTNAVEIKQYCPVNVLAGGNNPEHLQSIDELGQAYVRSVEGSMQFTGFGLSRIAQPELIGSNNFRFDKQDIKFTTEILGTASDVLIEDENALAMDVSTDSGDSIIKTTDIYFHSQPGTAQHIDMCIAVGDSGKTNVTRRWGYFDGYQGIFFELEGTDLYLVIRSSSTGSTIDTRVAQADWSVDSLDGTDGLNNQTNIDLDVSKLNTYWFDLRWAGAGAFRAGIYVSESRRIVAHEFSNLNTGVFPAITNPSLPVRYEIFNTGISASPSRLKLLSSDVYLDGTLAKRPEAFVDPSVITAESRIVFDGYFSPVLTFRGSALLNDGKINRKRFSIDSLSIYVQDNPVIVNFALLPVLADANFITDPLASGAIEYDVEATGYDFSGSSIHSYIFEAGVSRVSLREFFSVITSPLTSKANVEPGFSMSIGGKCLVSGETATITVSATFVEVG